MSSKPPGNIDYHQILNGLIAYQVMSFVIAYIILSAKLAVAPYGRYVERHWWSGPNVPARLSWIIQECPAVLIPAGYLAYSGYWHLMFVESPNANSFLLAAICTHYTYRSFIYPFLQRGSKPAALLTTVMAVLTCAINGAISTIALCWTLVYPTSWTGDVRFLAGMALFVVGFALNIQSDNILRNLRKPGDTGYKIPHGGLFEYVSCGNYFAEMMEWSGLALAGWSVPTSVMVAITVMNLVPRAVTHHQWYKRKFENYPAERKVVIPFLY